MAHSAKAKSRSAKSHLTHSFKWRCNSPTIVTLANSVSHMRHRWRVFTEKEEQRRFDLAQLSQRHGSKRWKIQIPMIRNACDSSKKRQSDIRRATWMQCAERESIVICSACMLFQSILRLNRRFWSKRSANLGACRLHRHPMDRQQTLTLRNTRDWSLQVSSVFDVFLYLDLIQSIFFLINSNRRWIWSRVKWRLQCFLHHFWRRFYLFPSFEYQKLRAD